MVSFDEEQHPIMSFAVTFQKMLALYMLLRVKFLSELDIKNKSILILKYVYISNFDI